MKRIVVTGAGGFIGRALCRTLSENDAEVIACIRAGPLPDGAHEARRIADITDREALAAAFEGADAVVHLAGRAHVMRDEAADPLAEYRRVNVDGTRAVADGAAAAGVRRVVFLSSVKVNGERTEDRPFRETDAPAPEDAYGMTKREAEDALFDLAAKRGLEAVCLRPPLVYGPGVGANFAALLRLCDSGLPLPFGCVTSNRRSLVYVGNLTAAIVAALTGEAAAGRTFLVRDGEDLSTAGLIRAIRKAFGRRGRLVPVPVALLEAGLRLAGRGAVADRLLRSLEVDDSAIRDALGWTPLVGVAEAMSQTVQWYRHRDGRPQIA